MVRNTVHLLEEDSISLLGLCSGLANIFFTPLFSVATAQLSSPVGWMGELVAFALLNLEEFSSTG